MAAARTPLPLVVAVAALFSVAFLSTGGFDVRRHLSTVTRYDVAKGSNSVASAPPISDECRVIHLNLVARHGTRAPTKRRINELDRLAARLKALINEAKQGPESDSMKKIPSWMKVWESPWKVG